ncbi:MAG: glucose-6-phosphate isomerase [Planctomycetota bacterium]|nr:MAG: glucose-6-phosphate isomerase [Planctomycetota bacterium]
MSEQSGSCPERSSPSAWRRPAFGGSGESTYAGGASAWRPGRRRMSAAPSAAEWKNFEGTCMSAGQLRLEYANVLDKAIGAAHGIAPGEIKRAAPEVRAIVSRIERERKSGEHRYRDLPGDAAMLRAVRAAVRRFQPGCENLVVLGIGGSALGNIALQTALNPPLHNLAPTTQRRGPRLFVMDNVDPVAVGDLLDLLGPRLRKTVFNVISKSGETAETAAQFLIIRDLLARKLGARGLAQRLLITTDPQTGTARQMADAIGCETLPVPPGVGGRFSVLSAVGLFSAGMCGVNLSRLMQGAAEMSRRVTEKNMSRNPAAMLAWLLYAFYCRGKRLHVMFPYSNQLRDLADWYRQLWAESLGKNLDQQGRPVIVGPTPIDALGATDQHSQVQLYREGPNDKVFIFLQVEKFSRDVKIARRAGTPETLRYLEGATLGKLLNAEKLATEYALVANQRPCMTIRLPKVSEHTVGQFIMLWEAATTIAGYLLNINPYDQPAVQMGKDYTYGLMGKKGYEKQARRIGNFVRQSSGRYSV